MVYILLAPGFEEAEALVPADLLRRAGVNTALVAVGEELIPGGQGITVKADMDLSDVKPVEGDMIVLPGGAMGYRNLGATPAVEELVKKAAADGLWVAAICAAPTLLGGWGLLEGKNAVCYPGMEDRLIGARVPEEVPVVRDGNIITSRGAGTAFDFGLELVAVLTDEATAQRVKASVCCR